jgi:thiol-disulfide isomerase/thioredoxin
MIHARLLTLVRTCLAIAIFATSALVIDYENAGDPAFCGAESACLKVRTSELGTQIAEFLHSIKPGLKLPGLALGVLVAMVAFTFFVRTKTTRRLLAAGMTVGAAGAATFIAAQVKMATYCAYCMTVDVAVIIGAIGAIGLAFVGGEPKPNSVEAKATDIATDSSTILAWGITVASVTVIPFIWARFPANPPLPPAIAEMQQAGKVVIVSFTDFECPYCRKLHPAIEEASKDADVVVKRMMVPLEFHRGAMPSALAYVCVPEDKQNELAHKLYAADPKQLTREGSLALAAQVGADPIAVDECMGGKEARDRIDREKLLFFDTLAGQGVPTTWVGATLVRGAQSEKLLSAASRASTTISLPVWLMFVAAGVAVAITLFRAERRLRSSLAATKPTSDTAPSEPAPISSKAD